jgi:hypothetical protein
MALLALLLDATQTEVTVTEVSRKQHMVYAALTGHQWVLAAAEPCLVACCTSDNRFSPLNSNET